MRVDEDNGRPVGILKGRAHKDRMLSINNFWKKIDCLILAPIFGLGGSTLW